MIAGALALGAGPSPEGERPRATAGGRIAWVTGDQLDLVGDLWADLAFPVAPRHSVYFAVDSRTTIEKAESDLTFVVRDLLYDVELGWRGRPGRLGDRTLALYVGQRGATAVDASGQAFVRYVAAGLQSPGVGRYPTRCAVEECGFTRRFDWQLSAGPVVEQREVSAAAVVFGRLRTHLFRTGIRGSSVDFDVEVDGLVDDGRFLADAAAGPRLSLPVDGGRRASFFAHYVRGRNPLGLRDDAWLLGFAYEEGADTLPGGGAPPEIDGHISAGGGEGRYSGQLFLRFLSPPFGSRLRGVIVVDGNILSGDDTDELYYRYHAGLERVFGAFVGGAYFYHRSNHQLAEPNDEITSINVVEAGVETAGWHGQARRRNGRWTVDARLELGYLIDSSFGEDRRWHARGGARMVLPWGAGNVAPYLVAEGEAGDVENVRFAAGLTVTSEIAVELEYREDDQYFSEDDSAVLLTLRYAL